MYITNSTTSTSALVAVPVARSAALPVAIRLTGGQYQQLAEHLFPGDGKEAAAVVLCGRRDGHTRHILTARRVVPIPHEACAIRTPDRVTWPTDMLPPLLAEAARRNWALLKIHSHPGGYTMFSETDDASDRDLFPSVYGWTDDGVHDASCAATPHASAVMLPDGSMFARVVRPDGAFEPVVLIAVTGDDLRFWFDDGAALTTEAEDGSQVVQVPEFARRHAQAFGAGTTAALRRLSIGIVGCSGTGSPLTEMIARLGAGELVLVDPDIVEEKNLNRIVNATHADADRGVPKVDVLTRAIAAMRLGTNVVPLAQDVFDPDVVRRLAECDVIIGCVDSVDARDLLNRLSAFYLVPYIDVGVRLIADGLGGVGQICGTVHYLQPDGSSLLSRGVYTPAQLQAAGLRRTNPALYTAQVREKYITGVAEDRPAVISVNFLFASLAVNELLARLHPFRDDGNAEFASFGMSLTQARIITGPDGLPCPSLARHAGRGDVRPLLDLPVLSTIEPHMELTA